MADLTPIITALLGGGYQGYQDQEKRNLESAKNKATLADKGFSPSGDVDPGYFDENNPSYKRAAQYQKFHSSPKAGATTNPLTLRQAFAVRGVPLPKELEADGDRPFDKGYANLFPTAGKPEAEAPIEMLTNPEKYAAEHPGAVVKAPFAGNFKKPTPKDPKAMPDQGDLDEYKRLTGLDGSGLTKGQITTAIGTVINRDRLGDQFKAGQQQNQQHFEEGQNLQKNKAVMDDATRLEQQIAKVGRIGDYVDAAEKMNMSYPDYLKLVARSKGDNVLGYFGVDAAKLSPDEETRLGKYREIGGGFVKDLFATGGKQLTGKEESLASRFEIQPGDSAAQIRTKGAGLVDYLESDFEGQIAGMEAVNPQRAQQLRQKAFQTISGARKYFMNASQKRAANAGAPQEKGRANGDQAGSAKKLNIPPGILEAISDPSQIVKKEYSPSRNKTRVTLKNGKSVVVSGDQR